MVAEKHDSDSCFNFAKQKYFISTLCTTFYQTVWLMPSVLLASKIKIHATNIYSVKHLITKMPLVIYFFSLPSKNDF